MKAKVENRVERHLSLLSSVNSVFWTQLSLVLFLLRTLGLDTYKELESLSFLWEYCEHLAAYLSVHPHSCSPLTLEQPFESGKRLQESVREAEWLPMKLSIQQLTAM